MDWRTIEAALVEIAKGHGHEVLTIRDSGDKLLDCETVMSDMNLTEIAKELAERLGSKA